MVIVSPSAEDLIIRVETGSTSFLWRSPPRESRVAPMFRAGPLLCEALLLSLAFTSAATGTDRERPLPVSPSHEVTLDGEVVDFECYLRDGSRGERHKNCALTCRKNGGSLAIIQDQTGDLYPVAGNTAASDPGAAIAEFIGTRVAVRGQLYERAGARILVVEHAERLR
jgi:hypothetical protein